LNTIAIASHKGGVGKTTLALNIAYTWANQGKRVLLVDTDPCGQLSLALKGDARMRLGWMDFVKHSLSLNQIETSTKIDKLDILTCGGMSTFDGAFLDQFLSGGKVLRRFYKETQVYDVVLFDTPSGLQPLTIHLMQNADYVLSPLQPQPLCVRTISSFLDTIAKLQEDKGPQFLGFILSLWDIQHHTHNELVTQLRAQLPPPFLLNSAVLKDPLFTEAMSLGTPLALLKQPAPPTSFVFEQIVAELASKINPTKQEYSDEPRFIVG
tara:strand:- start:4550 stop:5350 length:801 start_codon:yes stop_codon:yes gene_type:complete